MFRVKNGIFQRKVNNKWLDLECPFGKNKRHWTNDDVIGPCGVWCALFGDVEMVKREDNAKVYFIQLCHGTRRCEPPDGD